jgi:hypothetical protein
MDVEGIPWRTETIFISYHNHTDHGDGSTYALGGFNMLNQHDQLLLADETLET